MKAKETRQPISVELKSTVFDHPGETRGRLVYYYSARQKVDAADAELKRKLTRDGFYHIKKRNLRNNKIIFIKQAKIYVEVTEKTVSENNLTCLMITHNMSSALQLGTRTIMMADGRIIFDTSGDERKNLTVDDLLHRFKDAAGKALDNDRMLLS